MTAAAKGLAALLCANVIWGLAPLLYKALDHVPPPELLAHRTLWSLVFFGAILFVQRRLGALVATLGRWRGVRIIVLSAAMISINWGLFIWAVQSERTLAASIGYYIFPLVAVLVGVFLFGERLGRAGQVAVALAAVAVAVLTFGLDEPPWVSVVLALSFSAYSAIKKWTEVGPVLSVTAEVAVLAPVALVWLGLVHGQGGGVFGAGAADTALLLLTGPLTAGPLILFSYASRRLTLATVGLTQYLNPTMQLAVAVAIFGEPLTSAHAIALPLIWVALAIYSAAAIAQERARARAASSALPSSATITRSRSDGAANP